MGIPEWQVSNNDASLTNKIGKLIDLVNWWQREYAELDKEYEELEQSYQSLKSENRTLKVNNTRLANTELELCGVVDELRKRLKISSEPKI